MMKKGSREEATHLREHVLAQQVDDDGSWCPRRLGITAEPCVRQPEVKVETFQAMEHKQKARPCCSHQG